MLPGLHRLVHWGTKQIMNLKVLSIPRFYVINVKFRSPALKNCRMLTCICLEITKMSMISIHYRINNISATDQFGQYRSGFGGGLLRKLNPVLTFYKLLSYFHFWWTNSDLMKPICKVAGCYSFDLSFKHCLVDIFDLMPTFRRHIAN